MLELHMVVNRRMSDHRHKDLVVNKLQFKKILNSKSFYEYKTIAELTWIYSWLASKQDHDL